jgi:branched-chain amino acid transport system ATP-binding protein
VVAVEIGEDRTQRDTTIEGAIASDVILEVRSVTKTFGGNRAVDDCSFAVGRGTITGLIGPNGAGKTTLLNVIAGVLTASAGKILLDGAEINGLRPDELLARGLARTFQIPRPVPTMTVLENLVLAGPDQAGERIWNPWFRPGRVGQQENVIIDEALAVLEYVNLIHLRDAYAANLSGGQKKLLEFARTLMVRPRIVLLDEPAAGVNRTLMRQLAGYIEEQSRERGVTFLVVEHDMDLVGRLCDPVVVMNQGTRLFEGSFEEVKRDAAVLEAYLGSQVR